MATASQSPGPDPQSRVEAIRARIFVEMSTSTMRFRLFGAAPYSLLILTLVVVHHEGPVRTTLQVLITLVALGSLASGGPALAGPVVDIVRRWLLGATALAGASITGGVSSPILPMVLVNVVSAALTMQTRRAKVALLLALSLTILSMAAFSRSTALAPPRWLRPHDGIPSAEYVLLATISVLYVAIITSLMGNRFAIAYERATVELAATREELFKEGEDRTLALEGIAARLAHEVKNPLAAIKGLSTHMARRATDPEMAERLSIVASEADRLQSIVDGFLTFSRGLDDLRIGPVQPFAIARELALLLETRTHEAGIAMEVTGHEDLSINADGRKLRQTLLNLILNAVQASRRGGKVSVDVDVAEGGAARVRVVDDGEGMSKEVLERIRKPYFTTREGGSGLGLAVARGLVEQHGGTLCIESAVGRGTTVTVELPSTSVSVAAQKALPAVRQVPSTPPPAR